MTRLTDKNYLQRQYRDASNLNARIALHERFSTNPNSWHHWVFEQIDLQPESKVLELGCGPAALWVANLDRIPSSWDITLSDLSPGMVEEARQNLSRSGREFAFEVIDAQAIPYSDGSFDAVIANHVLHHVPDVPKALSEIHRVLKPGGHHYASAVGRGHMGELHELVHEFDAETQIMGTRVFEHFLLDNGTEQIERLFPEVKLLEHEDSLVVTEAAPLVDYVASMIVSPSYSGERLAQFARFVEEEIQRRRAITITKKAGMFVGRRI